MVRIKSVVCVLFLLLVNFINAQYFKIKYEEVKSSDEQVKMLDKIPDPKLREQIKNQLLAPLYYELLLDNNVSLYRNIKNIEGEDKAQEEMQSGNVRIMVVKNESTGIYQNYKTEEYLSGQSIMGRDFFIKDKIVKFDWKLTNETKKIGNFNAKKATATYDGKQVEAWYAEEIPINAGPGAYNGLPGLIVQVNSGESEFNAISVEKLSQKPTIEKPVQKEKSRVVTRDEFAKQIERIRQ